MKKLFLFVALFHNLNSFSQTRIPLNESPLFFIDSLQVHLLGTFDPDNIESINVVQGDSISPNGKLYITTKNTNRLHFLSAQEIVKKYKVSQSAISIFFLDNELIKDTSKFRIDSSYILNIEIVKASEIKYFPKTIAYSNLQILKIITATKENKERQNLIRLKGQINPG